MTNLFELMKERGIKQLEVAEGAGVPKSALSAMKNNNRLPNAATLIKISNYLDCSVDYLLDLDDVPNRKKRGCK